MTSAPSLTFEQAKAARRLLGRHPREVCLALAITQRTLTRAEKPTREGPPSPAVLAKMRCYYEAAGAEFTAGQLPGVRLTTRPAAIEAGGSEHTQLERPSGSKRDDVQDDALTGRASAHENRCEKSP